MNMKLLYISLTLGILQIMLFVLFFVFGKYSTETMDITSYTTFQDVHVMIFVGFGFLMTFLKRYGYSSMGFNLLVSSFSIQWAVLCMGFFEMNNWKIEIGVTSLYEADIATATVLISMGAVLGRTHLLHLIIMALIEIPVYAINAYLLTHVFTVIDPGGSIFIHTYGAYFGLAVSFVLTVKKEDEPVSALKGSTYSSDMFAFIGSVFLWIFWPSFNGIELEGDEQRRAFMNTYFALGSCTVTTYLMSSLVLSEHKFDIVYIQNGSLAGGVAVGAVAHLNIMPWGAILIGIISGILTVIGLKYLTPLLEEKCKIQDVCGIHNLHGMPGVLSGILSVLYTIVGPENLYGIGNEEKQIVAKDQAIQQAIGLGITLAVAILSGLITGGILRTTPSVPDESKYDDNYHWGELPD